MAATTVPRWPPSSSSTSTWPAALHGADDDSVGVVDDVGIVGGVGNDAATTPPRRPTDA